MKIKNFGISACSIGEVPVKRVFHGDIFIWGFNVTIWDGEIWSNGEPTIEMVAIINGPLDTSIQNNLVCDYLQNNSNIVISTGTFLTANQIHNNGNILVENKGNLFQHGNASFYTGNNITIISKTSPVYRYDFTYWCSPVVNITLAGISPTTFFDKYFRLIEGAWVIVPRTTIMNQGEGYNIRAPQSHAIEGTAGAVPTVFIANIVGIPNNGEIILPVYANKSNLIGNPYPSIFNWDLFYIKNYVSISSSAFIWIPKKMVDRPGGGYDYVPNYATYTPLGGVRVASYMDRITSNFDIARAFMIYAKPLSSSIVYEDYMRINNENVLNLNRDRYWLNCENVTANLFSECLIGYVDGFEEYDFSGILPNNSVMYLSVKNIDDITDPYSIISNKKIFNITDKEKLLFKATVAGNYTISLPDIEGLFENQDIFLVDKTLSIVTDLKNDIYSFSSAVGVFNDRFEILYQ